MYLVSADRALKSNFEHLSAVHNAPAYNDMSIQFEKLPDFTLAETMSASKVVFHDKATILRFSFGIDKWTIRGEGYIDVSIGKNVRLTMRDINNQILCDHRLLKSTMFKKLNATHIGWINTDKASHTAWEHMFREPVGVKFTTDVTCNRFLKIVKEVQTKMIVDVVDDSWKCLQCYAVKNPWQEYCSWCKDKEPQLISGW